MSNLEQYSFDPNKDDEKIKKTSRSSTTESLKKATAIFGFAAATLGNPQEAPHIDMAKASSASAKEINKISIFEKFNLSVEEKLPEQLSAEDIDPRISQLKILQQKFNDLNSKNSPSAQALEAEIMNLTSLVDSQTGWADKTRQRKINELLLQKDIQNRLKNEKGLVLADVISVLKAVVLNPEASTNLDKLNHILQERQKFSEKEIIGSSTNQVIIFNYAAKDAGGFFPGSKLADMARKAMGEKALKDYEKVKLISTGEEGLTDLQENAGNQLLRSIEHSSGNTVLYLSTHAVEKEIAIDLSRSDKQILLSVDGVASALLNRLLQTNERDKSLVQKDLGSITIIGDGCELYDFSSKNLIEALRKQYTESQFEKITGVSFDMLALPSVITMAGEKSPVMVLPEMPAGGRLLTGEEYMKKIEKDGALKGSTFFKLQAETYVSGGDMSFFIPGQGKLTEISSLEQNQKNFKYGDQDLQVSV